MFVPATRARVLTDEMAFVLGNRRSSGVWSKSSPELGRFEYRIVNNTHSCFGSRLIVFKTTPPRKLEFLPVDPDLVDEGMVCLCICKGTAVPIKHDRLYHIRKRARQHETHEAHDSGFETPTLCEVVVPSSIVQLADAPLLVEDFEDEEEDKEEDKEEPLQPVRRSPEEQRKHRNRQSAAKSRATKCKYISQLEARVCELTATAQALSEENRFWKSLELVHGDLSCPLFACKGFVFTKEDFV
jgi:hypothetical protein